MSVRPLRSRGRACAGEVIGYPSRAGDDVDPMPIEIDGRPGLLLHGEMGRGEPGGGAYRRCCCKEGVRTGGRKKKRLGQCHKAPVQNRISEARALEEQAGRRGVTWKDRTIGSREFAGLPPRLSRRRSRVSESRRVVCCQEYSRTYGGELDGGGER